MLFPTALAVLILIPSPLAPLATTTHYTDNSMGACGCGTNINGTFPWQYKIAPGIYTAAGSAALFDPVTGQKGWCGTGCGSCYNLTNQGISPEGNGAGAGQSIVVMVTNLCPYGGNEKWCPPKGQKNKFGYDAHFDIMLADGSLGWVNPVVSYTKIACPLVAYTDFKQCYCATHNG